ncbi:MAG: type 2 isopentenyl-diphosphate Delta-isomerase [Candidatus Heimdallarchaeota archaeon]|nr:type 2 isopentenyl-diphosphate Delta-isomerase [Candidatus Heimdallarchaeota archaeon]MDH5645918.1 type 2 isopentenyl-diphosphate Delta-isomerase [Candidatus Heimdallarchaeota archaeon]
MSSEEKITLQSRKAEHVKIVLDKDTKVSGVTNGFEDFHFVPNAIPDLNYNEINMNTIFLNNEFDFPVLVAGMTGGYPEAEKINSKLAQICSELNIPFGVGSQRAMVVDHSLTHTFDVKKHVKDVFLIGNLGLVQFCQEFTLENLESAINEINVDAMAIHINAFQEICQPAGDLNFKDSWNWINKIIKNSPVPIIIKEVGSGIARDEIQRLDSLKVHAIDVGGAGGTSWPKIEIMRHENDESPFDLDDPTLRWGINTALATWEATSTTNIPIISTGGMYHGLMGAKALAMGATMIGVARPVLQTLMNDGSNAAKNWLLHYKETIKRIMFLLGVGDIENLMKLKHALIPQNQAYTWLKYRKFI